MLYYHLNNTKVPQKVAVVVENANPSEYYLWVGKNTQRQYLFC